MSFTLALVSEWCVSVISSTGPVPRSECVLSPVNSSHPVHALLESFTVLSGCASRGTMGMPQEVHILNLRNPEEGLGHHEKEVKGGLCTFQTRKYKNSCKKLSFSIYLFKKSFFSINRSTTGKCGEFALLLLIHALLSIGTDSFGVPSCQSSYSFHRQEVH